MRNETYWRAFLPYALAALLIGLAGGFSSVLGPAVVQDLGLPYSSAAWTALAQAIASAACAPVMGRLGDWIGRPAALLLGIAVFAAGNALAALADNLPVMLAARFAVGLGMAAIAPVVLAHIVAEFPKEAAAKGFAAYMLISSAAVIPGPTLGGMLLSASGWRSVAWLCTALCAAALPACVILLGRFRVQRGSLAEFDKAGAALTPLAFGLLLCLPAFGQNIGWTSAAFFLALAGALLGLAALIYVEERACSPLLPGSFMRRKTFVLSVAALFLTQGLMQANMTNMIVFVNSTQPGNSALSGYAISAMYVGMSLGAALLGPLADRYEPKGVLLASLGLTGAGCALLWLFESVTPLWLMMASLGVLGFGLGGNGTIFLKVALSGLSPEEAGAGTGTYGLFRDLAAPFGVAVLVPMFANGIEERLAAGAMSAQAAVQGIHDLAAVEVFCVAVALVSVWLLPSIRRKGV